MLPKLTGCGGAWPRVIKKSHHGSVPAGHDNGKPG